MVFNSLCVELDRGLGPPTRRRSSISDAGGIAIEERLIVCTLGAGGWNAGMSWPDINNSQAIYDSFLGSGTNLIAAENDQPRLLRSRAQSPLCRCDRATMAGLHGRAAMHQASGQSFDERAGRQDHNQSGAAHGAKTIRRD